MTSDFLPTADLSRLRFRARVLAAVREFFTSRGYWEVETPVLSHDTACDAHLEPLAVPVGPGREMFLQTSPEFGMKRLLAAGSGAIFQITRAFRHGERGPRHNPEFTLVEWYRPGDDDHAQMGVVEQLVRTTAALADPAVARTPPEPFLRTSYQAAFLRHLQLDPLAASLDELRAAARDRGLVAPPSLLPDDRDGWLNLLLAEFIEPHLGRAVPEFLHDYPASQGALARLRPDDPRVAQRFELYLDGVELCNGYHELLDADELAQRNVAQAAIRAREGLRPLPTESRLLAAMRNGLPPCAGVALGFDRLVMWLCGAKRIDDVWAFPFERA